MHTYIHSVCNIHTYIHINIHIYIQYYTHIHKYLCPIIRFWSRDLITKVLVSVSRPSGQGLGLETWWPRSWSRDLVAKGLVSSFFSKVLITSPGFCPFPLLSEYICYDKKLNITLNFMFHMYDKKIYNCDITCS